ncbi:hypothetical protein KKG82_04905 [Patescibacteria group bacterium]|nr:hypothetical protein [Patescibacteria group bacterium]
MMGILSIGCGEEYLILDGIQEEVQQGFENNNRSNMEPQDNPESSYALDFDINNDDKVRVYLTDKMDGHGIILEILRGPDRPLLQDDDGKDIIDPELPAQEIDARFISMYGQTFMSSYGGHGPVNPNWGDRDDIHTDIDERARDFEMAVMMIDILANEKVNLELFDEANNLIYNFKKTSKIIHPSEHTNIQTKSLRIYQHHFLIHYSEIRLNFHHSATADHIYYANRPYNYHYTKNHGRGPFESGMRRRCLRTFNFYIGHAPFSSSCADSRDDGLACCNTGYGKSSGHHVCNDDTLLQKEIMILEDQLRYYDHHNQTSSTCRDWWPRAYAPSCN